MKSNALRFNFVLGFCFFCYPFHGQLFSAEPLQGLPAVTLVAESKFSRVLFRQTGECFQENTPQKTRWCEIAYKLHLVSDDLSPLFGASGIVELQFRDRDDAIVFFDLFSEEDFLAKREYYGYLWATETSLHSISRIRVQNILPGKVLKSVRERDLQKKELELALSHTSLSLSSLTRKAKIPGKEFRENYPGDFSNRPLFQVEENLLKLRNILGNPASISTDLKAAISPAETPRKAEDTSQNIYQKKPERITNDDVENALKELEEHNPEKDKTGQAIAAPNAVSV